MVTRPYLEVREQQRKRAGKELLYQPTQKLERAVKYRTALFIQ